MTRSAIRALLIPLLRDLAGEAAQAMLLPCTRLVWWTATRRRILGRKRRIGRAMLPIVNWRIRKLWGQARDSGGHHCDGALVATEVVDVILLRAKRRGADTL